MARTVQEDLGKPLQTARRSIINPQKKQEMKNSLLFDFTVDKATNAVYVKREFAAGQELVWNAFTKQEILDRWWAP